MAKNRKKYFVDLPCMLSKIRVFNTNFCTINSKYSYFMQNFDYKNLFTSKSRDLSAASSQPRKIYRQVQVKGKDQTRQHVDDFSNAAKFTQNFYEIHQNRCIVIIKFFGRRIIFYRRIKVLKLHLNSI